MIIGGIEITPEQLQGSIIGEVLADIDPDTAVEIVTTLGVDFVQAWPIGTE